MVFFTSINDKCWNANPAFAFFPLVSFQDSIDLSRSKLPFFLTSCSVAIHENYIYLTCGPQKDKQRRFICSSTTAKDLSMYTHLSKTTSIKSLAEHMLTLEGWCGPCRTLKTRFCYISGILPCLQHRCFTCRNNIIPTYLWSNSAAGHANDYQGDTKARMLSFSQITECIYWSCISLLAFQLCYHEGISPSA